ncbi:N-acetylmuramidase domain-containing protein [Caballeronia arationis]|uniref:N-acetylmuramidase domain-containing protein n=1 Tax=Caballeronia arationis TaxID=1777142 RepID=UPI000B355E75|nr:N-acetylmuramidase domain-containing protein [Caballeronia arationis]
MAIAEQETEKLQALGLSAFDKQCRPTILFERHKFGKITNQKFSEDNPDMSGSKEYLPGSARDKSGKVLTTETTTDSFPGNTRS